MEQGWWWLLLLLHPTGTRTAHTHSMYRTVCLSWQSRCSMQFCLEELDQKKPILTETLHHLTLSLSAGCRWQTFTGQTDEHEQAGSAGDWDAGRESILWIHIIYGHFEVAKGHETRADCRQIPVRMCVHAPSLRAEEKWGYLAASALLIFALLYLVFLLIYLSGIYSLAPSHKPFQSLFCIAEPTSKKKRKYI